MLRLPWFCLSVPQGPARAAGAIQEGSVQGGLAAGDAPAATGDSPSSTSGEVSAKPGWGSGELLPEKGSVPTAPARAAAGRMSCRTRWPEPRSQPLPPQAV